MIHYHVWFNLKETLDEASALEVVRRFLGELQELGAVSGFRLLRNSGASAKTKLPRFHALIEFANDAQFSAAFASQAARGIHAGLHGQVLALVNHFQVEIFREVAGPDAPTGLALAGLQACEI